MSEMEGSVERKDVDSDCDGNSLFVDLDPPSACLSHIIERD